MGKHDVRFVPRPTHSTASNGLNFTATSSSTSVTATWYEAVLCDCARCRAIDAVRRAGRRLGALLVARWQALDRIGR